MTNNIESGEDVVLYGKSGATYRGKIYTDKNGVTELSTRTIVGLSNSKLTEGKWEHQIRDFYNTEDPQEALLHFRERDDITHLILIPSTSNDFAGIDQVHDLIQNYIHK